LLVRKTIAAEKSTLRLSPNVNVALSKDAQEKIPQGVGRLFDLIEEHET
jgi:hypothetical protein